MKLKFADSKQYNLIFKDAKGDMVLTEDVYERLLRKAYKGKELADYYEIPDENLNEIFEDSYDELGYPRDTTWFIHPDVLRDNSKMKALYDSIRVKVLDALNDKDKNRELYNSLIDEDYEGIKDLFNIRYTLIDKKYIKDDEWDDLDVDEEDETESGKDEEEKGEEKLINATCKEFLEEYENKLKKDDPRYYLIEMALGKSKGWAYIKEKLGDNPETNIVTPKNAKKIMKLSENK